MTDRQRAKKFRGSIQDELKRAALHTKHATEWWQECDVFKADYESRRAIEALQFALAQMVKYIDGTAI